MSDFFSRLPKDERADIPASGTRFEADSELGALLRIPGVEGYAPSAERLLVYVQDEAVAAELPRTVHGKALQVVVTGTIHAQD